MSNEIEKLERRWQENPLGLTFAPLAEAYRKAGDSNRALELLETGLAQHPNYVPAHIVRGRCHLDRRMAGEAELAFRRVLELDRENVIALKALADLAESDGRAAEAMTRLEALLEVDRNNDEARDQLERLREPVSELVSEPMSEPVTPEASVLKPFEASDLSPKRTGEFQLADDEVPLSASNERLPEIILQAEALERSLPMPEAAQGLDMIAAPDPLAARGTPFLDAEPVAPAAPPEAVLEPTPEREFEPEPEPEPEAIAEPETIGAPAEPELVVTETMAEIFLRQGHRELALAVYSQLAQRDPANGRVSAACAQIQSELTPPPPPAPEPLATAEPPRYDAAATGGRSVAELFVTLLSAERPTAAPPIHPPAFEAPRRPSGEPTRPAADALSLSSVFGEAAPPAGPAGAAGEPHAGEPSFEQFFMAADGSTADIELPKPPESEAPALSSMAPEDLEQFNAWLRGLKR